MPQLEGDPLLATYKIFRAIDQEIVEKDLSGQVDYEEEVQWAIGTWQELLSLGEPKIEYTAKIGFESGGETTSSNTNYSSSHVKLK